MYTKNVDSSVHKQIQFENTCYTSSLRANNNIGCPYLQQSELVYSGICKSGYIKGASVIIIFGVIKIILVRGVKECTDNAANFEF